MASKKKVAASVTIGVTAKTREKDGTFSETGTWFPDTEDGRAQAREAAGPGGILTAAKKYEETDSGDSTGDPADGDGGIGGRAGAEGGVTASFAADA